MHHKVDWLDRVDDTTATPRSGPLRVGQIVVEDLRTGRLHGGAEAVEAIFRQIPLYWPMLPLLKIPALRRRAADDANAQGRHTCSAETC